MSKEMGGRRVSLKDDIEAKSGQSSGIQSRWTGSLLLSTFLAALASFNFGYNISVINTPAITFASCKAGSSVWHCFPVTKQAWSLVVSIMLLGALVGSLATGPIANRVGRRLTIILLNVPFAAGFLFTSLAVRYWMLLLGRFLVGLGVGAGCIVVPLYLSEIAPVMMRGQVTSVHQLAICVGLVVVELIGLSGLNGPGRWRIMFALGLIPAFVQVLGMMLWGLESPRFLAQRDDAEGCRGVLKHLRGSSYYDDETQQMLAASSNAESEADTWSFLRLLQNLPLAGRSLTVSIMLHVAQQFSGINVIFYFSSDLFSTGPGSSTIPALISILNLAMAILSMWLVERAGRRILCLGSTAGIVVSLVAFIAFYLARWQVSSVICILAYVASYAVGMGPIPWLMVSELFPTQAAGAAVSLAVSTNWACNFLVGSTWGWLSTTLGQWALAPYAAFTAAFLVFAWFQVPETKGRPIAFL